MTEPEVESVVREVTDEECTFYREMGWCMLPALVDPSFAAYLLERGRQRREERAAAGHDRAPFIKPGTLPGPGSPAHGFGRDEEPFHSLMFSQRMARNAQRLCDREPAQPASQPVLSHAADYKRACLLTGKRLKGADVPMRYRIDIFGERPPGGAGATPHQDACEHGSDRVGELQFWLALAAVSPEMGAMRFVNASHKEGPLGSVFNGDEDDEVPLGKGGDLLAQYPNLVPELGLSAYSPTYLATAPYTLDSQCTSAPPTRQRSHGGRGCSHTPLLTCGTGTATRATTAQDALASRTERIRWLEAAPTNCSECVALRVA